jgi:hypothetical protein
MKTFKIGFWETSYGTATVNAETEEEAKQFVHILLKQKTIHHKDIDNTTIIDIDLHDRDFSTG